MASAIFLVIAPLNSIIEDQFTDRNSKGYRAATLSSLKPDNLKDLHIDIILGLAEEALSSELKNPSSRLYQRLCYFAMDKCHTVETSTGKNVKI